jgi:hypothetical protein
MGYQKVTDPGRRGGGLPSLVGGTGGARAFNVMPASVTAADPTRSLWQVPGSGVLPDSGALNAKNQGSCYSSSKVTLTRASTVAVPASMGASLAAISIGAGEAYRATGVHCSSLMVSTLPSLAPAASA